MRKTNFTKVAYLVGAFLPLILLLLSAGRASAQAMACNNLIQVSVDNTPNACQAVVTADMILEGTPVPGHDYSIVIHHNLVPIVTGTNQVTISNSSQYFGAILTVTITDLTTNNSCWGQMHLEDKLPPVITCTDITINCSANLNTIALPSAVDNCDPSPDIQLVNEVINSASVCANGYATIIRSYVATDDYGNTSASCNRTIFIQRPSAVDFPNDIIWTCDQYNAFQNIVAATPLHPYVHDTNLSTPLVIDVNLYPTCDDNDSPNTDNTGTNSTNVANGGSGCPGNGLDDADVLALTGSGIVANIVGTYCNYQQTHADAILQTCGSTFKIVRTWTVLDWCSGAVVVTGVGGEDNIQIIKVIDNDAPSITRAPFSVAANIPGVHPQPCRSQAALLPATFFDSCSTVVVRIYTPVGEAIYTSGGNGNNGGLIPAPGLPLGTHNITYQATDACNNQTTLIVPVTVIDNISPVAICDQITDVNLGTDGFANVFASTFDDGSYDNCCIDHFEVRRMNAGCGVGTTFGPTVKFCCADITASPVTVVFRVYDCYNNFNECMVQVNVSDKIPPVLVSCPANERRICDWYAANLETQLTALAGNQSAQSQLLDQYFGTPTFTDNCTFTLTRTFSQNLDQCLEGTITRTWSAKDPSNNNSNQTCNQTIFIDHVSDWVVEFPADITVNCGTTAPVFGEPEIFYETCELVAVSHNDVVYTVVPDACYKIARTWTLINWCVVGNNIDQEVAEQPENQLGLVFPQCDLDGDGDCDNRTFRDSWRSGNPANLRRPTALDATRTTDPDTDLDSDPWDGYIVYTQVIKVNDTVDPVFSNGCQIPDVCILDNTCTAQVVLPTPAVADCSPNVTITVEIKIGGVWVSGFGPFNLNPGTYDVRYVAMDNCNNQSQCTTTVTVKDCKKPTPYCKNGLVIELMNSTPPMVQIWANDFNAGSFDNCPGTLKLSFSSDVTNTGLTFDCDDEGQQPIQMWVTDAAGNQDYCETFVIIQANMGQCGSDPLVAVGGAIANEEDESVENVMVSLSGQSSGTVMTDNTGSYSFTSIPLGNDLTVTPSKDDDPLNGVTTFDLVLISKHILSIATLDSPYKIIAADANKSNAVTTADLVELRKLILQITSNFANNTSWRFVDAAYVFPNQANPWAAQFNEIVNINNIPNNILTADFVAVKIGDVNSSAITNFAALNEDRNFNGAFVLTTDDAAVKAGETTTIEFRAKDLQFMGYQFTLNFDKDALEFVEMTPGLAKEENFGFTLLDKGAITTSWNGDANTDVLFSAKFLVKEAGKLSNLISVNSRYTAAEAYTIAGELLNVQLNFNGQPTVNGFELYQNTPNPFKGQTMIGFNLAEGGFAKLTIADISGRVLSVTDREFTKGYNEVRIDSKQLPASGVLYYTLETATETATKRMVILD